MNECVKTRYKYEEIKSSLLRDIRTGALCQGDKLPVRTELVNAFNVTRSTIDKALNDLISENILTASRRNGTFVVATPQSMMKLLLAIVLWISGEAGMLQNLYRNGIEENMIITAWCLELTILSGEKTLYTEAVNI